MAAAARKEPDRYEAVARERMRRLAWLRANPGELPRIRRYYRTHIADWINDWGLTVDPRNAGTDRPVVMPFLLDPKQREWCEFTFRHWRAQQYGMTVKSRDVGVSWLIVAFDIGLCVLWEDVAAGWGSFKQEKVDRRGDMGSMFEKGRAFLEGLPHEWRGGYDPRIHGLERRLMFPNTRSSVIGEIGDNIGRGGRTSIYHVDEAAYLEHDSLVDAALSKNTLCRQDVSSVHGMQNSFAQRAHSKSILEGGHRFDFHWRDNPRMTQAMYDQFLETWGAVITAQELDMNFQASVDRIVIPSHWLAACVGAYAKLKIKASGEYRGALDVSDGGRDKNAFAGTHGLSLIDLQEWTGKDSDIYATTEHAFGLCDTHKIRKMRYDADGLGSGVRGDARKINEKRNPAFRITIEAHRGSAAVHAPEREMVEGRKNADMFLNFKAQAWWWFRMLVFNTYRAVTGQPHNRDMLINIDPKLPLLNRFLIEASQPTYDTTTAGKMIIDKQPEGTPSPNLADAAVIVYAPRRSPMQISDAAIEGV